MLTPIGIAMLFRAFPPIERARAATIVMVPTLAAPALGPVLGGLITDTIGWRWIFFVNVPIGLAALVFGLRFLREHTEPGAGRFDVPGFVLSGFGLGAIAFALNEGPRVGWDDPVVVVLGLGGVLAFALLVWVETHRPEPMLALRLLRDRLFATTNLVMAFGMASFVGLLFVLPLYLQGLRGLDPFDSGLVTFPQAIGILVSSQVAGRIYGRVGPRRLIIGGMLGAAVTVAGFTQIGLDDRPVDRARPPLRSWPGDGVHVRRRADGELRPHRPERQREGVGDLLHPAADVGVDRRGVDGDRPVRLHPAGVGAGRSATGARGLPLGVRGLDPAGADRGGHRHPHQGRGRGGDDGSTRRPASRVSG